MYGNPFPQGSGIYVEEEAERLLTAIGGRGLWGHSVFKIQQGWYIFELAESTTGHIIFAKAQNRKTPGTEEQKWA